MILSSNMYDETYLPGSLERVLEVVQVSNLKTYPHNLQIVGSPLQSSSLRDKKAYMSTTLAWAPLVVVILSLFIDIWCIFLKNLKIMSISTNIHTLYVCDLLGLYISLVNISIKPITPY